MEQTLAVVIDAGGRFRQGAPLTAGDDSLETGRCTFYFGHGVAPRRDYRNFSVAHSSTLKNRFSRAPQKYEQEIDAVPPSWGAVRIISQLPHFDR